MPSKQTKTTKKPDERARNWYTVVYPDSAPEDWQETLAAHCVPAVISPLHDKDVNPGGEPKKPHWHVMVMFEGKKSTEQVKELFSLIGGVGIDKVLSMRGYGRYLCHLDNPEKAQYEIDDVKNLSGADYLTIIGLPTDKYKCIKEMMQFCKVNQIYSYADLLEYCSEERMDWFRVLCDNGSWVMIEYLKSKTWTERHRPVQGRRPDQDRQPDTEKNEQLNIEEK